MSRFKVMVVFGTRPEAIKIFPVIRELSHHKDKIEVKVVITGQHREMLKQVLDLFSLKPDLDLKVMTPRQSLTLLASKILRRVDELLRKENPSLLLVQGDTTSALSAALAAFYNQTPLGHIEAGLRTYDLKNPYPEEMNRRIIDSLSDVLFAPTSLNKDNLLREGKSKQDIFVTGNTVVDALLEVASRRLPFTNKKLSSVDFNKHKVIFLTTHRRENFERGLVCIYQAIRKLIERNKDILVIFPVHLNPIVQNQARKFLYRVDRVLLLEPLNYQDTVQIMKRCFLILTDSGGLQEEAPSLNKPVLVLRKTTERGESLKLGLSRLVGQSEKEIITETENLLKTRAAYDEMIGKTNPYGDGKAASRIVEVILKRYVG